MGVRGSRLYQTSALWCYRPPAATFYSTSTLNYALHRCPAPSSLHSHWFLALNYLSVCKMSIHVKARIEIYPRTEVLPKPVKRCPVPDDQVPWDNECPGYDPQDYTSESVLSKPVWADPQEIGAIEFNKIDAIAKIDRSCHEGPYEIVDGRPRNPCGRTGLRGRGCLGRWGPNHAADPIVTRWKRTKEGEKVYKDGKPVLQFIAVQRSDNDQWALPGGMVDPDENRTVTLKREFGEEALNTMEATDDEKQAIKNALDNFFSVGRQVYAGYVDDPRNTDNSWMETRAINFHDDNGKSVAKFSLNAGDDAKGVRWMDINSSLQLYASHKHFILKTAEIRGAYCG